MRGTDNKFYLQTDVYNRERCLIKGVELDMSRIYKILYHSKWKGK
jgi:hypothetical protein